MFINKNNDERSFFRRTDVIGNLIKTMIRLIFTATMCVFLLGCNGSINESSSENGKDNNSLHVSKKQDTLLIDNQETDSVEINSQDKNIDADKKSKKNIYKQDLSAVRYIEFPGDVNFNGKPMTQQIEIPEKVYKKVPDTLSKLAIANYKTYDTFFPKAISDNFEEGISREIVMYPEKLIFRFKVFENEFSSRPYITKDITIRRNDNSEPYAE